MAKIRANDHYVPEVADPLSPIDFRQQDQRPELHGVPVDGRADGRPLPDAREHMTGTDKKWFTYTNGVHTDSLDPETYNKPLRLPVALRRPAESGDQSLQAGIQASWPVAMQAIWGIQGPGGSPPADASLPPDPIQDPTAHPTIEVLRPPSRPNPSPRPL